MLASASDSSGKPTARNERGLAADSALPPRLEWQAAPSLKLRWAGRQAFDKLRLTVMDQADSKLPPVS
ncbi:MAG: hypothetical protein ACKVOQ_04650 [Cyclobacteriaceae bacterium]